MATKKVEEKTDGKLPGGVTQDQLEAWKAKHKEVFIVSVKRNDGTVVTGYFKKAGRDVIANCVNMASTERIFEAREFLAKNTFLGGDPAIDTDEDVSIAVQVNLWKSLNFLQAEVQKY